MIRIFVYAIFFTMSVTTAAQVQAKSNSNPYSKLGWQFGVNTHSISRSNATIQTLKNDAFLKGKDAHEFVRLNEGHGRNKPDAVVFKRTGSMANSFVLYSYAKVGYITMDDWEKNINADKILRIIKINSETSNKQRAAGYSNVIVDGWVEKPRLDRRSATVYWAIRGHTEDGRQYVNAKALKLGKTGLSSLVWVGTPKQFHGARKTLNPALEAYKYQTGWRYADFRPGVDSVAAVGVGAIAYKMLTGRSSKVAAGAGAGMLAAIALIAKKLWFLIFLPFIYIWKFFGRLFSRDVNRS
jgi:uncharacterized membrane-anchored protein